MKRITQNRIEILRCLTEGHHDCGLPPYSVSSIHYMLFGLEIMRNKPKEKMQCNQIRRTLEDLLNEGIVIVSRRKNDSSHERLPFWEREYQITDMAEQNYFEQELKDIERKISHAFNGFGVMFGGKPDGDGLTAKEIKELTVKVKAIIQKSHPDKPTGNIYRFKSMKKCLDMLRDMPVLS